MAEFLDYLIEVSTFHDGEITKLQLSEAIEAYGGFLQLGVDAGSSITREVAAKLSPGVNSSASLIPKKVAVRRFLRLSEDIRKEMAELAKVKGKAEVAVDGDPLLPGLNQRQELRPFEVHAMQANSMLAGVIAGGPKLSDCVVLDGGVGDIPYAQSRAFPYDRVLALIDAMPTFRDKALYAFLAASGCRTHEALQLLMEDIDVLEGSVRLVGPETRIGHASYRALSAEERAELAWKGRTTQLTLLIELFASKFFESLKGYLDLEHIAHGRHDFVFQYLTGKERGKPSAEFLTGHKYAEESRKEMQRMDRPVLHFDQGWHYRMQPYRAALARYGMKQSMSRKGNCFENAAMESFFATLKVEYFHLTDFKDVEQLNVGLKRYINYYNQHRIKLKLGGMSPAAFERGRSVRLRSVVNSWAVQAIHIARASAMSFLLLLT